ncbi:ribonuclease E inhibitor RraB [Aeromicrobium sp.]|uniref:ribonuclease E inhibitor RraB n=1 Tax=Aeromicrobium sp. TaxID=1871063 RepID=UPI002FC746F2
MGIFGRKPAAPQLPTTGHAGDDQLLAMIAQSDGGLEVPRHWLHYVYCDDNEGAAVLEAGAAAGGWTVQRVVPEHSGIVAEREDWPVNLETVPQVRAFFESLAASVPGGDYDGWEASA